MIWIGGEESFYLYFGVLRYCIVIRMKVLDLLLNLYIALICSL